jgi:hypothetical protein
MNQVYNVSAKDGTVMGITTRNVTWDPLYGEQVTFDPTKLSWLGSLNSDTACASSGIQRRIKPWTR